MGLGLQKCNAFTDSKYLEFVMAHDDAVNSVNASGVDGLVFIGSVDVSAELG